MVLFAGIHSDRISSRYDAYCIGVARWRALKEMKVSGSNVSVKPASIVAVAAEPSVPINSILLYFCWALDYWVVTRPPHVTMMTSSPAERLYEAIPLHMH
jgi:hypothetical protein